MDQLSSSTPNQSSISKKQTMLLKRIRAKQLSTAAPAISILTKQDVRKERNRCAAQKSRDKKKEYLEHLEQENMRMKDIISRCQICSAENQLHLEINDNRLMQGQEKEEILPITQSPPIFTVEPLENQRLIREDHYNEESSSNLSKFFWFGCLVILVCMANLPSKDINKDERLLFQTPLPQQQSTLMKSYIVAGNKTGINSDKQNISAVSAVMRKQINYCAKCMECLKNMTNNTKESLSLLRSQINQTFNNTNTTQDRVLFCKSKAKFFHKIYAALMNQNEKQQKNSREITKMLVKGKALNQLMQQDCFNGELLEQEQEYIISFNLAILQMTPVKMGKTNKLSLLRE